MDEADEEGCDCVAGAPAWMATLGDLMSLLLTFFVLLLTFSNTDKQLFLDAMGSIQNALGIIDNNPGPYQIRSSQIIEFDGKKSTPFLDIMKLPTNVDAPTMDQKMLQQMQQFVAENNLSRIVETETGERGLVVRVKGQAMFEAGGDTLLPEAVVFLDEIVRLTGEFPYDLSIEGHTDNVPIRSARLPSNWHLSANRAIAVLQYMVSAGVPASRLNAAGFGSTRPIASNDFPEGRTENRRVEFVYLRDPKLLRPSRAQIRAMAEPGADSAGASATR